MDEAGDALDNGVFEIHTLNVGQADARAAIPPDGRILLFDADEQKVAEELDTVLDGRKIDQVDGKIPINELFVSHIDRDHIWGIESLHENYRVKSVTQPDDSRFEIADPDTGKPEDSVKQPVLEHYISALKKHDIDSISHVAAGEKIQINSDTDINVLSPPDTDEVVDVTRPATDAEVNFKPINSNENGAVYKLDGEQSALFMGDVQDDAHHHAESWLMQKHDNPESDIDLAADVAFIGHHGSNNATSEEFLDRVDPEVAVISSDFAEQHNHPHDTVLKNLHEHDVDVSWTAGHGTTRTDLDKDLTTNHTTNLDTTNAADLTALKHYCGENETTAEDITLLAAEDLPEETPEWVAESAPMVAETTQEMVDTAIENSETVQEVRQTLDDHPAATEYLRETVEQDRAEAVTSQADVRENRQAYRTAQRAQAAAQPSKRERVRESLPFISDPDIPEYDGPAPDEIEGPFTEDAIPPAVTDSKTAATIRNDAGRASPPDYLVAAEEQANTAVETAENAGELCWGLRDNPGAHKDVAKSMESVYTHLPASLVPDEQDNSKELSADMSHDKDQEMGLGL